MEERRGSDRGSRRAVLNAHMYPYVHVVDLGRAKAMGKAQGKVQGNPALDHNANEALAPHNLRLPCQASLTCATTSDEIFFEVTCGV